MKRFGDEHNTRLYSMLDYGKYLILSIGGNGQHENCGALSGPAIHMRLISPGSTLEASDDTVFVSELVNPDDDFTVVVRPDMYIGEVITRK